VKRGGGEVRGKEEAKAEGASAKRMDWRVGRVDVEGRVRLGPSARLRTRSDPLEIASSRIVLSVVRGVKNWAAIVGDKNEDREDRCSTLPPRRELMTIADARRAG
jgi:hypothetical protein